MICRGLGLASRGSVTSDLAVGLELWRRRWRVSADVRRGRDGVVWCDHHPRYYGHHSRAFRDIIGGESDLFTNARGKDMPLPYTPTPRHNYYSKPAIYAALLYSE